MLLREELDRVPWAKLQHAYGAATDTPDHLLALLSSDRDERERALYALWASICHQGSVYEASCAAVPFLIRILKEGPADGRASVLYLLAGLAHRDWYANRNVRMLRMARSFNADSKQEWWSPGEFLTKGNEYHEVQWMTQAHKLVAEGISDYVTLLMSDDDNTVQAALHLLAAFSETGERVVEPIAELLTAKTGDDIFEADALLNLSPLLPEDSPHWKRYTACLVSTPQRHPLVCYTAAVALARYRPGATPAEAIDVLVNAVVRPQQLDELYEMLSGYHESVHLEACQLLSQLPAPSAVNALITALDRGTAHWRVLDTIRVAEALLDAAFFGGWVQGRYWSYTVRDGANITVERVAQEMIKGDDRPYEERSYHSYGRSYHHNVPFTFEIATYGYDEEAATRLRDQFAHEGNTILTHDQRQVLEAVLRCAPLWDVPQNLLDIYGLPRDRASLEMFLDKL